jgi:aminopeptidase C
MKKTLLTIALFAVGVTLFAQDVKKEEGFQFTTVKEIPITSTKNQNNSGTCWAFSSLGFFEAELLRMGKGEWDFSEMYLAHKTYEDRAKATVRLHGDMDFSQGGSFYDCVYCMRHYGMIPQSAMPEPGTLQGDSLPNFTEFFSILEPMVSAVAKGKQKKLSPIWFQPINATLDTYLGECPTKFTYNGKTYTPQSFMASTGLNMDDYISLTSFSHHPFYEQFVIEAPYKWRLKPSYNIPIEQLMDVLDKALDAGYTVAWGGDVTGDFTRTGVASLPDGVVPTQQLRQEQWDDWRFTYDHVMLVYGKAIDEQGKPYYLVKNSWGETGSYKGIWYMSRDYMMLNTTYLFLNRHALPEPLKTEIR